MRYRFRPGFFKLLLLLAIALAMASFSACDVLLKVPERILSPAPSASLPAAGSPVSTVEVEPGGGIPDLEEKYFIKRLPAEELKICERMYTGIKNFEPEIRFEKPISEQKLKKLMWLLSYDCPELYQINGEYSYFVQENEPERALSIQPTYILTRTEYEAAQKEMRAVVDGLKKQAAGLGQYETQLLFYNAMIERCAYREDGEYDGTAYGALVLGHARCEGYSKALSLLMREAGIECLTLTGEAWSSDDAQPRTPQKHAWNVARIDGAYYQMDITWDDSDGMLPRGSFYAYFNLTDEEIYRSRTLDSLYETLELPSCTENTCNYFIKTGNYVPDGEDVKNALHGALDAAMERGDNFISIRLATDAQREELADHLKKWMTSWYRKNSFSSGSYNWTAFAVSNVFSVMDIVYE
ncbi:MAG TPA: transglutaminase domain-containing protein [Feifaniaceae bacterium]|nr:transglutaminase domain-containing protein [Feifaniaceae bacterium]